MPKILLVDDSSVTQTLVVSALKEVCEVCAVARAAEAVEAATVQDFDLILLDVNLPDGSGFDIYNRIREIERHRLTPILFLTGRIQREDKVKGFSLGADDYIVKPFDLVELQMRISAKLKNLAAREASDVFDQGPFEIRPGAQKINLRLEDGSERKIELTASQFKVLYYLIRNVEKTVTREELLKEVWSDNTHVSGRTVDTHIYALRKLLGPYSKMIQSVHRKGYRLSFSTEKAKKTA